MRIAVLCPTRGRPEGLKKLAKSVVETSKNAWVLAYVDMDQRGEYRKAWGVHPGEYTDALSRSYIYEGERCGPVASMNALYRHYRDQFDVFGMIPDDATITTPEWDRWVAEVSSGFKNGIGVLSPAHNLGNHVDMPFVTRRYADLLGWVAYPGLYHWAWPTATMALAEGAQCLVSAKRDQWYVDHQHVDPSNQEMSREDAKQFYAFMAYRYQTALGVLRNAG